MWQKIATIAGATSLVLLVILCGLRVRDLSLFESQDRKSNAIIGNGVVCFKHRSARGVYMAIIHFGMESVFHYVSEGNAA
jgi:hypothetical protein